MANITSYVGKIFYTGLWEKYTISKITQYGKHSKCDCVFDDGNIVNVYVCHAIRGKIRNKKENNLKFCSTKVATEKWRGMIDRCYKESNSSYKNYGFKGVLVCDEWLNIDNFIKDIEQLPRVSDDFKSLQIDKDIFGCGNLYSKETCCLVPRFINNFFEYKQHTNKTGRIGVCVMKNKFSVFIKGGSKRYIGQFENINDASMAYWSEKVDILFLKILPQIKDINISNAIINKILRDIDVNDDNFKTDIQIRYDDYTKLFI